MEALLKRNPVYRTDGTEAMLRDWLEYQPARARWYVKHCT